MVFTLCLFLDRPGVKDTKVIGKLGERINAALRLELDRNHLEEEQLRAKLDERIPILRFLSVKHSEVLQKFKDSKPDIDFPALHKELFSQDNADNVS